MGTRDITADSAYRSHVAGAPEDDSVDGDERDLFGPETPLSRDDVFGVLRDGRRRTVLQYLITQQSGEVPLSTLAAYVAAVEHEITAESASVGELQSRVRISLHHSHLPRLDEAGVVHYDPVTRTVEPNPLVDVFEPFLAEGTGPDSDLLIGGS